MKGEHNCLPCEQQHTYMIYLIHRSVLPDIPESALLGHSPSRVSGSFLVLEMRVKWHMKPRPVKRPAKHPHCFHNDEDQRPPRHGCPSTHTSHFPSVASLTVCALLAPLDTFPALVTSLTRGFEGRIILTSTTSALRLSLVHLGNWNVAMSSFSENRCFPFYHRNRQIRTINNQNLGKAVQHLCAAQLYFSQPTTSPEVLHEELPP
jgi:hypothetical protein